MNTRLLNLRNTARQWLFEIAWPMWGSVGLDPRGGFRERLGLDATPIEDDITRVRVQARQIYCFSVAVQHGWEPARILVRASVDDLRQHAFLPNGLVGMRLHPGAGLVDESVDLYDVAFAIFALSYAGFVLDDDETKTAALNLWVNAQTRLADRDAGGYKEALPDRGMRRQQNPHMHLLEALIALYQATGNSAVAESALALERYAISAFIDSRGDGLREFSVDDSKSTDNRIEAGHQYEWFWLLHQRARVSGDSVSRSAAKLLDIGRRLTPENMRIPLSHHLDFSPRENFARCWTLTEALKANLLAADLGDQSGWNEAARCAEALFRDHLIENGGWIDRVDLGGTSLSKDMPASTFYHVVCAFDMLIRAALD